MRDLRVEKLERRLPLTAGFLDSTAYIDQEIPHFQMNVLEGSRVERQIAFDIPWEYVHQDNQVLLDFSVQGNIETVSNIKVTGINARQVVHQKIRDGLSPLVSKTMSMMKENGLAVFDVLEPAVQISNISRLPNIDGPDNGSSGPKTPIRADSAVYKSQSDQSARAYALFETGLGVPQVADFNNLVAPAQLGEYAEEAWENITALGPDGIIGHRDSRRGENGIQYLDLQIGSGDLLDDGDKVSYHIISWWKTELDGSVSDYQASWSEFIVGSEQNSKIINESFAGMRIGGRRAGAFPAGYDWGEAPPDNMPDGSPIFVIEVLGLGSDFGRMAPDSWLPSHDVEQPFELVSVGAALNTQNQGTQNTVNQITGRRTPSGLTIYDTHVGRGPTATNGQTLTVHYSAYGANGEKYDSSRDRGTPFRFELGAGQVIQGWEEGLRGMSPGGRRTLIIPPSLAYEDRWADETTWHVELLEIDGITASATESSTTQNFQVFTRDPLPLSYKTHTELNFVTRFTADLSFDVTGTVGDFSEITLTVNPNVSISFAEQIELGSLNIVDSFVIESDGNEAVTRTIDGGISVGGRPLMMGGKRVPERFNGWSIIGAEAVDGENVVFARRGNGTMHRLVADTNWALHGFLSVRNMHSSELSREARFAGSPSLRKPFAFVGRTDSEQLWNSVASQLLADGTVTADVAECISHAHALDQQTARSADTYISEQELLAAAPIQVNTFEFPFSSPMEISTTTSSGGGGVMGGGSSPVEVTLQTTLTPPPDHLVHLTLYEWDLTAAESDEANLASLQELLSEHAFTAAGHLDDRHSDAGLDQLDCGYMVFHNTLRPAGGFYGTTTGGNTGSGGTNNNTGGIGFRGATSSSTNSNFLAAAGNTQLVNAGNTQAINLAFRTSTSVEESVALAYTKSETLLRVFRWHQLF